MTLPKTDITARRIKLLVPMSDTALEWHDQVLACRAVYSLLAYRDRHGKGASGREISKTLRIHQKTVAKAIATLGDLVIRKGNKWHASQPGPEVFKPAKIAMPKHWSDSLAYVHLYLPKPNARLNGKLWTLTPCAIWSVLVDREKQKRGKVRIVSLAIWCGLGRATVQRWLKEFVKASLIVRYGDSIISNSNADLSGLFVTKADSQQVHKPDGNTLKSAAFWDQKATDIESIRPFLNEFAGLIGQDEAIRHILAKREEHDANLKTGKTTRANFCTFVKHNLRWELEKLRGVTRVKRRTTMADEPD